jgi:hypothetical protein
MNDWANQLLGRFPLLERLRVRRPEVSDLTERLPPFLGILMAVMEARSAGPVCFILPRRGDIARLAAVLYGLHRFCAAQAELTKGYGESNFQLGDLVRIHPGKHVFRYGGFDPRAPEFICLRPINGTDRDRWSVRASTFVPRLERTTLTRPIGKMNTPIHDPELASLDRLLGTSTFGNQGLFRNELVLLDSASGFQRFAEGTVLQPVSPDGDQPSLQALIPLGDVAPPSSPQGSWLTKWDGRNPSGEPLIATTSSAELLASLCIHAPAYSKLVVVNGVSRMKDLQSFDDVRQTQRLVLFADHDEEELIESLGDRGCRFWELTATEISAGHNSCSGFEGMLGKLRLWARNKETLKFDAEPCENGVLDNISIQLDGLRQLINTKEDAGPVTKLVGRIWRILNETAAVVRPLKDEERQRAVNQLKTFRRELQANKAWLTDDAEAALSQSAADLESLVLSSSDIGDSKRAALEQTVAQCLSAGMTSVVLVRSENQALDLDERFRRHISSGHLRVSTPRALKNDAVFDRIICLSWPGSAAMQELAVSLAAPRITLLGYAFERRWLNQCAHRLQRHSRIQRIGDAEKFTLVSGLGPSDTSPSPFQAPPDVRDTPPVTEDDIWSFEQRLRANRKGSAAIPTQAPDTVPARYASFVGITYAFLTETHRVVVVTDLASVHGRTKQRLPEKTVVELRQGDFIVFPESGDRELIQEKADQLLGSDAPRLRKTAHVWKEALWASSLKPAQFLNHARDLGRPRHIMTIRNWFADSSQIGPGTGNEDLTEDLELISLVTDHEPLKTQMQKTIEAIRTLRSAHLSAGVRLRDILVQRLPEVIGRIEEEGSEVDLGELGSAWIVQVESIAATTEPRGRGEVNRLLSENHTAHFDIAF